MSESTAIMIYRSIIAVGGIVSIFLGYRLFSRSLRKQGELSIKHSSIGIKLSQVAPGVFFAFFGALILIMSLLRPLSFTTHVEHGEIPGTGKTAQGAGDAFHTLDKKVDGQAETTDFKKGSSERKEYYGGDVRYKSGKEIK